MMRNGFLGLFYLLSLLSIYPVQSQTRLIHGFVIDSKTRVPIAQAHVNIVGEKRGTITDSLGSFVLQVSQFPCDIFVSHLGYSLKQFQIKQTERRLEVKLEKDTLLLAEAIVRGNRISPLTDNDSLYIIDYLLAYEKIIAYGVINKNPKKERIWLMSRTGEILFEKEIDKGGRTFINEKDKTTRRIYFFKDCFGEVHFLNRESVWQLWIQTDEFQFLYKDNIDDFLSLLFPVKVNIGGNLFYSLPQPMHPLDSAENKDNNRWLSWHSPQIHATRQENPPVFNHQDTMLIFNFKSHNIEFYNKEGIFIKKLPINFYLREYYDLFFFKNLGPSMDFKKEILRDEKKNKYYALFEKGSINQLHEVNIHSGKIVNIIEIPHYPFIKNIQIDDGEIFFMYVSTTYPNNQILYHYIPKNTTSFY